MSAFKKTVLDIVGPKMTAPGRVEQVVTLADRYRLIDIVSEGFTGAVWEPAAKVKIDVGRWDLRTYTPIEIDPGRGRARLLLYLHGASAASRWGRAAGGGVPTRTGGPKTSLALADLAGPAVFFGDETSFAAAATLHRFRGAGAATAYVLEAGDPDQAAIVIAHLGLQGVTIVRRHDGAEHLDHVATLIRDQLERTSADDLILTGNGRSIQTVRAALKTANVGARQHVKAYWAPGKIGLD